MDTYLHRVVGLYPSPIEASAARDLIVARGMASSQISIESPLIF